MIRGPAPVFALALALLAGPAARGQQALDQALPLRRSGHAEEALAVVEKGLARAPRDEALLGLRGILLLDLGRDQDAAPLATRLADYSGGEFRVYLFLGRAALQRGENEAAFALLERSLACKPDAIEPATVLVQAQLAAGKLRAAIAQAEQLEAVAPELGRKLGAQAWVALGRRHREGGKDIAPLAIDDYRQALAKQPDDLTIAGLLADTLIDLSFTDEARRLIDEHFDAEKNPVDWHYLVGRWHAARFELAEAQSELDAVLAIDPRNVGALLELAGMAIDDGRDEQARGWLETALQAEPRSSRAWMMAGQASEGLHDDAAAEADYRKACQLSEGNHKARYLLGRLLLRTGREAEGQSLLQQVVNDDQ